MPAYLVYVLLILAISTIAGFGFKMGGDLERLLTTIGLAVVLITLWEPLIKPAIEKLTKK